MRSGVKAADVWKNTKKKEPLQKTANSQDRAEKDEHQEAEYLKDLKVWGISYKHYCLINVCFYLSVKKKAEVCSNGAGAGFWDDL